MKAHRMVFPVLAAVALACSGCISVDHRFNIAISRPTERMYFTTIQWQTDLDWREDRDWEKKAEDMARAAIKAEFLRLGLACDTIVFESPTPYIGDWVSVDAAVGSLSEEELRREKAGFFKTHITGQPLPASFHRGHGEFPPQAPNPRAPDNDGAVPVVSDHKR